MSAAGLFNIIRHLKKHYIDSVTVGSYQYAISSLGLLQSSHQQHQGERSPSVTQHAKERVLHLGLGIDIQRCGYGPVRPGIGTVVDQLGDVLRLNPKFLHRCSECLLHHWLIAFSHSETITPDMDELISRWSPGISEIRRE